MEAINSSPKIMQEVRRGEDLSSLQTLTMTQQGLAMFFCVVCPAHSPVHSTGMSCTHLRPRKDKDGLGFAEEPVWTCYLTASQGFTLV